MRDRLIELMKDFSGDIPYYELADHLLANGVIVPTVGIGTKIYAVPLYPRGVYEFEVEDIDKKYVCHGGFVFNDIHLGKTVFLTREEAEKALAEREGKG